MRKKARKNKKNIKKLLHSKAFLVVCLAVLVLFSVSIIKEIIRKVEVNREINDLQSDISDLENNNEELTNLIDYLNSSSFQEKEIKTRLNLKENGEKVVYIPENNKFNNSGSYSFEQEQLAQADAKSNPKKWVNYFFK